MKILYYSPHPLINMAAPSGPGTHIREVIRGFESRGHEVIRSIAGGEEMKADASIRFTRHRFRKFVPSYLWHSLKDNRLIKLDNHHYDELLKLIEQTKPDVIYERAYYLMSSGARAAKEAGVRYYAEINAPYPEEKRSMEGASWYTRHASSVEKKIVESSETTFTVSSALQDYLVKSSGQPREKIVVTPNAVNPGHIKITASITADIRKRLRADDETKIIGFVGSIFPYHGVDILLEAFRLLHHNGYGNTRLLIVGDGEILEQIKQEAGRTGVANEILFTGNVPHAEVYSYIDAMDITVMARSNWYGSPVKIFEYGAMKKLVIAPDEIPVHDVMQNNVHGIITKPDAEELYAHLVHALHNHDESSAMAERFYQKVITQHTWQHVADEILKRMQ